MTLTVNGKRDQPAKVAISVNPKQGTTIIKGRGQNAEIFQPSEALKEVGKVPCNAEFQINFYRRPWDIDVLVAVGEASSSYRTTSEEQGLPSKPLLSPDSLVIQIKFEEV